MYVTTAKQAPLAAQVLPCCPGPLQEASVVIKGRQCLATDRVTVVATNLYIKAPLSASIHRTCVPDERARNSSTSMRHRAQCC